MTEVKETVTKKEAFDVIFDVLDEFKILLLKINDKKENKIGTELGKLADLMAENDYMYSLSRLNWYVFENLNADGYKVLLEKCRKLSEIYKLGINIPENITVLGEDAINKEKSKRKEIPEKNTLSADCWKVYLDKDKIVTKVEYGKDREKVQIIYSDGKVSNEIEMAGKEYEGKGFAKKLLTAAGIETTKKSDEEMQNRMLDDGLFYINKEEGWIEKEKYFARMTPNDFLTIQDYKNVTVKAVYDDSIGKLTFTYTVGGKTENLFVIDASNNQRKREWPTINGTFNDKPMNTMPNNTDPIVAYKPGKFPKGIWKIETFIEDGSEDFGPYKIRTNAYRNVVGYERIMDENNIENWVEIKNKSGVLQLFNDGHLLIHGGGPKTTGENLNLITNLDSRKGNNNYNYSTLGCIRISNIDVLLIVDTLSNYLDKKKYISLEIK